MPLPLADFLTRLRESCLVPETKLQTAIASIDDSVSNAAERLARELVRQKILTEYQTRQVYQNKLRRLMVGNYRILNKIGSGGMGQVYQAWHPVMQRSVALKLLSEDVFESPDAVRRFRREVVAAAKLDHPNIVSALDAGEEQGRQFFVMQYVDGCNLSELVAKEGPLPIGKAIDCILQSAYGLQHAHERGVVHRDIKPGNLLRDAQGVVKILDLGLAKFVREHEATPVVESHDSSHLTLPGQMLGTAEFVSPEQAQDTREADERSDVYSLGCTLYFLLAGEPPYGGDSIVARVLAHEHDPIPSLCEVRDDASPELDALFAKMVAKAPEDRYQTVTEFISVLASLPPDAPNSPLVGATSGRTAPKYKTVVSGDSATLRFVDDAEDSSSSDTNALQAEQRTRGSKSQARSQEQLDKPATVKDRKTVREPGAPQDSETPDVTVARWVLSVGGHVVIQTEGGFRRAKSLSELPNGEFTVEAIGVDLNQDVRDHDFQRFKSLTQLKRILAHGADIGDNALKHLRTLRTLEQLSVGQTRVSDVGLAYLVTLPNLKDLSVCENEISDRGLLVIERLGSLRRVVLTNTQVTAEGVTRLQAAIPECSLVVD